MWPPQFLECERRGGCYCQWGLTIQQNKRLLMQRAFSCTGCSATAPPPHQVPVMLGTHTDGHVCPLWAGEPRGSCCQDCRDSHLSVALLGIKPGTRPPPLPSHSHHYHAGRGRGGISKLQGMGLLLPIRFTQHAEAQSSIRAGLCGSPRVL